MLILTTKYDIGTAVADIVCGFSRQKIVLTNLDGRKNSRRSFVDLMFESVDIVVVRFKYQYQTDSRFIPSSRCSEWSLDCSERLIVCSERSLDCSEQLVACSVRSFIYVDQASISRPFDPTLVFMF